MIKLYKNIDLVQINIKAGQEEYLFPKNVAWANKVIDKIILCAPQTACLSPIDGTTHVLTRSEIKDLYFSLYDGKENEIVHSLHFTNLLHTNNHPIEINNALSLNMSRLDFSKAPTTYGCILLYVFYSSKLSEDFVQPTQNITVTFPLAANEKKSWREIIDTYVHAQYLKVKGIQVWGAATNPAYLTLRDHSLDYIINSVHTELCRPQTVGATAENTQLHPFYLDSMDIDFDYSFITNASATGNTQTITIEF